MTRQDADRGAFKTPDASRRQRAPALHARRLDRGRCARWSSSTTAGGTKNPWLSAKIFPLGLTDDEMDALVAFMEALDSDLPPEVHPHAFPQ